ncbi:MAG TPA: ATP-binding protein, partial [Longimicrobiaceae bacterium]|nr:ATP-binding protein [Longimicrobiaceae bacterium]
GTALDPLVQTRVISGVHGAIMASAVLITMLGRRPLAANLLALVQGCIGTPLLLGFAYGGPLLLTTPWPQVNLAATLIAAVFPFAVLAANGPSVWPTAALAGETVPAMLLRWLVPLMAAAIVVTDVFTVAVFRETSPGLGTVFNAVGAIGATVVLVTYVGGVIERRLQGSYAALRASERRLSRFFEENPVPMAVSDQGTARLVAVNPAWLRLVGARTAAEVLHRSTAELGIDVPQDGQPLPADPWRPAEGVAGPPVEIRRLDGESRLVEISTARFGESDAEYVLVTAMDVTHRMEAEAERSRLEDQLRHSQRMEAMGQLAGGVAHDFNNLLTVIVGAGQIALAEVDPSRPEYADIEEMVKAGYRAADLTRQLLTFSRRQVVEARDVDLNLLLADTERMLSRLLAKNIALTIAPAGEPAWVRADPGQLEQVIVNLAVNARDAMPAGGRLAIRLDHVELSDSAADRPPEAPGGRYVRLSVSDSGVGMTAEVQERIFEPFFTTKEVGKGTGLGLSTVFGIIRQSDGFVRLQSEVGQGSTFQIYLPAVGPGGGKDTEGASDDLDLSGAETVLVAEHDPEVRALAARALSGHGYRVIAAGDAEEAIALSRAYDGRIDLLIAGLVMDGMGGHGLSKVLCRDRPELLVVYVSGHAELERSGEHPSGLNAPVLYKPFSPRDLARCVRKVLGASGSQPHAP